MDPSELLDFSEQKQMAASSLTKSEMELRDRFVEEYLQDRDSYRACIRIGYSPAFAKEFSNRFMNESYVLNKIKQAEVKDLGEEELEIEQKRIVASLWREANHFGLNASHAARVAAIGKLMSIYGMEAPTRSEITGKDGQPLNGGGVFVIPGLMTPEQWAEAAEKQQRELVQSGPPKLRVV